MITKKDHILKNQKGIVLIITMFVFVILTGLSGVFILRTVHESRMVKREVDMTKSFYFAEAGSHIALDQLDNLINNNLQATINTTNPSVVIADAQASASGSDALSFLIDYVENGGVELLTLNGAQAEYSVNSSVLGSGTYQYDIIITQKSSPVAITSEIWDFPYLYRVEANGGSGTLGKDVKISGDFTIRVQRDNFARYALFTNNQTLPNGTNVWFKDTTNFAGPLHTNGRYNFYGNPSGTFEGLVQQYEQTARYYNSGWSVLVDDDHNGSTDVPVFNTGFNRGVDAISLSSPVQEQDMIDQATGAQSIAGNGIYVPNNGADLTGGIYIDGDASVSMAVDGSDRAVYTIVQGASTVNVTVDNGTNQTTVDDGSGPVIYTGKPDGIDDVGTIIYATGAISSLSGQIQADTEVTVASQNDIVISDNITYAQYNAAVGNPGDAGYVPPNVGSADNLLGIVTWNGDVRIGTSAPDNVNVHGTILAKSGIFQVDSYNNTSVGPRGTATMLGGVISDYYGAFGLFYSSSGAQASGYGRNFVYDERMQTGGKAPPYFPTLNTFIAFTNDITDKLIWQEGG